MKRPTSDEQKSLFEATIAAEGVTTVIGNVGGTTFEDGGLAGAGANSFVSMLAVIHPGEAAVDSRDVTAFNDATGEVTVATAFKGGQVAVGTPYKIVTFRFVPAEVAALLADIGDASGSTLGSLYAILGNPAQTFLAMIGYEGATALANKLTAARAGNLDNCTYLERLVSLKMNCTQTLNNTAGNKDFVPDNATGASGLSGVFIDDTKVQQVSLLLIGRAANVYDGTNALDCATASHNQWRANLDGGAYADLVNEEPDGQMLDNDWRCNLDAVIHPFTLMFDVTSLVTNIDGKIGIRLENGRSEQTSLIVTIDAYLRILWKL